jgi:arsenate reductase
MKVYAYANCDTCRKALKYLDSTKRPYELKAIRETPPTMTELKAMLKIYEGKLGKLFNSSGKDYRDMKLGERLPKMDADKALELLSKNGNLVKRPFLLAGNTGVVGFNEAEWKQKGLR